MSTIVDPIPHPAKRSPAPDLARGFMLLLIAVAHAPGFVAVPDLGPAALNTVAEFLRSLLTENQARPMFVFLFGYGLGQLTSRAQARGDDWTSIRKLLRRRSCWLILIGFANAVLLVPIDVIAVYGLTLLILAPLVRARGRVLWWTSAVTLVPATALISWQVATAQLAAAGGDSVLTMQVMYGDYGSQVWSAVPAWPVKTLVSTIVVVPGMLLGIWAARRRVLDEPQHHTRLLRRVALSCLAIALVGRLPLALQVSGIWSTRDTGMIQLIATTHSLAGYFGGIGMAAAVGLVVVRLGNRRGRITTALSALGQRSMTFYIFQSVVWVALFYPFTFDLSRSLGSAAGFAIAVAMWLVSVVLAELLRRGGRRGPAEALLRRLADRRPARKPRVMTG